MEQEKLGLKIRGQDGRFVDVDSLVASLKGRNYTLVVEDSEANIVYFEHPGGDSKYLAEDLRRIKSLDLKDKLSTIFCPHRGSKRNKHAKNIVYFVEAVA